jgi:hypothetical protein
MQDEADRGNVWSIALVGGDGVRTKEFIRRWLGAEKPEQYCTLVGSRSVCQHTLNRTARLPPGAHSLGRSPAHLLREIIKGRPYTAERRTGAEGDSSTRHLLRGLSTRLWRSNSEPEQSLNLCKCLYRQRRILLSRMLKKSASDVLASLRDSTYRSVRLPSSLAAALLEGLFEHPETILTSVS